MRISAGIGCAVLALALTACSSGVEQTPGGAQTTLDDTTSLPMSTGSEATEPGATTTSPAPGKATVDDAEAAALQARATEWNHLVIANDAPGAWEYYSQRCQQLVGGVDVYGQYMAINNEGRNPQIESITATVDGPRGEVVTVDADPGAPAGSGGPRVWTRNDGVWQFDNC